MHLSLFERMLNDKSNSGLLDINCCDPLGRSALLMGIDNENLEMVELLLDHKVGSAFQNIYRNPRLREPASLRVRATYCIRCVRLVG